MPLGTNNQTITTGANFIPEIWGPWTINAVESNLVFAKLAWDWSDPTKEYGDTIRIPNVSNLTANTKTANSQVTLNAPTENLTNLTIDTNVECSFLIEDMLKVQSKFNLMKLYTDKAGYAIARNIDTTLNNLVSGFSQTRGSAGVDIGDSTLRDSVEDLDVADVPRDGKRYLVIYPDQVNALSAIDKFFRADIRGDGKASVVVNGNLGTEIYGLKVYVSTNVGTSGGARLNLAAHEEAIALARQLGPRVQSQYKLEYTGNLVVADDVYGSARSRNTFAVWVNS